MSIIIIIIIIIIYISHSNLISDFFKTKKVAGN